MKKGIALALTAALAASALTVNVFARTENRLTKTVNAVDGTEIKKATAPELVIESSDDLVGDFSFDLSLKNALWNNEWGEEGEIQSGIKYMKMGDARMRFFVTGSSFDATRKDIRIPLAVDIDGDEDAEVTVDGKDSGITYGTYTFARLSSAQVTFKTETVESLGEDGKLNDLVVEEKYMSQMKKGDRIRLKLTNGFDFTGYEKITGIGKFNGCVAFSIDNNDPSQAYIEITSGTGTQDGSIVIFGVTIAPTDESQYGDVGISLTRENRILEIVAAKYGGKTDYSKSLTVDSYDEKSYKPGFKGTGGEGRIAIVKIDGVEIGRALIGSDEKWEIKYPENMEPLEEGEHNVQIGYYDPSSQTVKEAQEIVYLAYEANVIKYVIGKKGYAYNGEERASETDGAPYIDENGRTMLPVRAVANSLSIDDDDIIWDGENQTITIKTEAGDVVITIGSQEIVTPTRTVTTASPAVIRSDGRTYLPLRAVMTALGILENDIQWDEETKTVTVLR